MEPTHLYHINKKMKYISCCFFIVFYALGYSQAVRVDPITVIDLSNSAMDSITSSANFGDLHPISATESLLNVGFIRLMVIDNETGRVIKTFDPQPLAERFSEILIHRYPGQPYVLPEVSGYSTLPSCQKFPFHFERFFRIESTDRWVCRVSCWAINPANAEDTRLLRGLVFLDQRLNLVDFFEVEEDEDRATSLAQGGFFDGEHSFFARYFNTGPEKVADFVLFQRDNGSYKRMGEMSQWPKAGIKLMHPGRFLSAFKLQDTYYINNVTSVITTTDLALPGEQINPPLEPGEGMALWTPMSHSEIVALVLDLDDTGASRQGRLVLTDKHFLSFRTIKHYDLLKFTINSVKSLDGVLYLFLFDRKARQYLLERIDLRGGSLR